LRGMSQHAMLPGFRSPSFPRACPESGEGTGLGVVAGDVTARNASGVPVPLLPKEGLGVVAGDVTARNASGVPVPLLPTEGLGVVAGDVTARNASGVPVPLLPKEGLGVVAGNLAQRLLLPPIDFLLHPGGWDARNCASSAFPSMRTTTQAAARMFSLKASSHVRFRRRKR
jgi:hypothetical protein